MQIKPTTTQSEPPSSQTTQIVYILTTVAGRQYTISKEDYEGIQRRWKERDFSDSILTDDGEGIESVLPFRNIDSISKERRTQ